MSNNQSSRKRSKRAASLQSDVAPWRAWFAKLSDTSVLTRFGLASVAALIILLSLQAWQPPFPYRKDQIPARDIIARVPFEILDSTGTDVEKNMAAQETIAFYENNSTLISQLRSELKDQLFGLLGITETSDLSPDQIAFIDQLRQSNDEVLVSQKEALAAIQSILVDEDQRQQIDKILSKALDPIEANGLLRSLKHDQKQGNQGWVRVFPEGQPDNAVTIAAGRVRLAEVLTNLRTRLDREFAKSFESSESAMVSTMVFNVLKISLPETLSFDQELSEKAQKKAIDEVAPVMISYQPGVTNIAQAGKPLTDEDVATLRAEHDAWLKEELGFWDYATRLAAFSGMIIALYLLCGFFIYSQFDRQVIADIGRLSRLLSLVVASWLLAAFFSQDPFQAQLIPVVMAAIAARIAYGRPMGLMLSCALAMAVTLSLGLDLGEFVVLTSAAAASVLLLDRIRTRTRLIYVGLGSGLVCALTAIGIGVMQGQVSGVALISESPSSIGNSLNSIELMSGLLLHGARVGLFAVLGSILVLAGLPYIERFFSVQTDLSLLELGDASQTLLRQLAQRAPGTYNHSINVAAIAEAAADSIGAHGLLTRVGAYFHDIGKMFKPDYFIENQGQGPNSHDQLQPAMSTLVIIAHVKDGADLARQNKLPQPFIDFIEQHHGTTLVEYFYRQATMKNEESNSDEEISELNFRYPGPKPQTHEAAVLMLADAVESASRALVEPTPSRIQSLVDKIAMKRLLDGQFDECGLTLKQLDKVKQSLVKTLTAIYHGRVKYPDQQSA